jgi:UDP-N-acetylmuramate dehydrogenase
MQAQAQMPDLSLPCPFEREVILAEKSYYRIGGRTRFFALPDTVRHIGDLLLWNREHRLPLVVMGSGSNMLFSDEPFPGVVISMERMNRMFWLSPDELFCEAGVENTAIAAELLEKGRSGGEWLHLLPGCIGSTIRMNARCFGGEVAAVTASVAVMDLGGRIRWVPGDDVFLGYKQTSLMESREIVLAAVLRFCCSKPSPEIRKAMDCHEKERHDRHHFDFPSCGSTFKNNYDAGRSSGMIFEELGFKGCREGDAKVSEHHANFIFNTGRASSGDVLALAARMRRAAREKAGVDLDLEVECTGLFPGDVLDACGVPYVPAISPECRGWAGLLWSPGEHVHERGAANGFPRTLLQGYLTGYSGKDLVFPPDIGVHVEQLLPLADAAENPGYPFLQWTTLARSGALAGSRVVQKQPGGIPGDFTDGLWNHPVSELFIGSGGAGAGYLEFEMRPSGDWVALRFSGPRMRDPVSGALSAALWEESVQRFLCREGGFGMTFSFGLLRPLIEHGVLSLQCAASLGNECFGLFPWWHPDAEKTDFHQPGRFFRLALR